MGERQEEVKNQGQFAIQKIYLKDASFESKNTPKIFQQTWEPKIELQISNFSTVLGKNLYEVELSLTATTKLEDTVAFLVEVHMAGIFNIEPFSEVQLETLLGAYCPEIIYPYGREVISDLVVKGGFPPLLLAPINFDALYEEARRNKQVPNGVANDEVIEKP